MSRAVTEPRGETRKDATATDGRSPSSAPGPIAPRDVFNLVGTVIADRFRVERTIGEGGYGVVYGGTHLLLGVPVAIKCLKPVGYTDLERERAAQSFLREARILFGLSHPAIVRLYDVGIVPDRQIPYAVLELLAGTTIQSEIALRKPSRRHFDRVELVATFGPILEGVAFAHERGIVHRDLKPSNMMLVSDASRVTPKVLDFGTARVDETIREHAADGQTTTAGMTNVHGAGFTPLYAAPEQWDAALGPTSPRTDVFALGLTLAEACLLAYPFDVSNGLMSIFRSALDERSRPLIASQRPDLPVELEHVILRALRVQPEARYPDARELLSSFRAALKIAPRTAPLEKPLAPSRSAGAGGSVGAAEASLAATGGTPPTMSPHLRPAARASHAAPPPPAPAAPAPAPPLAPAHASPLTPPGPLSPRPSALAHPPSDPHPSPLQPSRLDVPPPAGSPPILPWAIGFAGIAIAVVALVFGGIVAATTARSSAAASGAPPPAVTPAVTPAKAAPPPPTSAAPSAENEDPPTTADRAPIPASSLSPAAPSGGGTLMRLTVQGAIGTAPFWTAAEIVAVAESHRPGLNRCVTASSIDPALVRQLSVTVAPDKHGLPGTIMCSARTRSESESTVCRCIEAEISTWKFPAAHGKLGFLEAGTFIYEFKVTPVRSHAEPL